MATVDETIRSILDAAKWDQRVAQIRLIPKRHGTADHLGIHAEVARSLYVPNLAPEFAYVHEAEFYSREYFEEVYAAAHDATRGLLGVFRTNYQP